VKAAGPLLLTQSAKLSEAYAQHQLRLAEVEATKELMVTEARMITEVRKKLIDRYLDASPEDRVRLRQDIETTEREFRQLGVYQRAIDYVPEKPTSQETLAAPEDIDAPEQFNAWLDTFNEYARKQNEPWRADLLSRALAIESVTPGALGQRALWFIGTVDEVAFHAFAALIDIALYIGNTYVIPNHRPYLEKPIPTCAIGTRTHLGNILFQLGDLGLVGDVQTSQLNFPADAVLPIRYGAQQIIAKTKEELKIKGVILTSLGEIVARLYQPKPNELGQEIYNAWVQSFRSGPHEIVNET
jgi:hypothetical protein